MGKTDNFRVVVTGTVSHAEKKPASLLGKDYSILPATMMVEGAYYPYVDNLETPKSLHFSSRDLKESVSTWNGRPVAVNHPSGQQTCNSPEVFDKQWVGYIFNTRFEPVSKSLKADLWIEDERGKIVSDLVTAGKQLEVSIGAFGDLRATKGSEPYDYTMTNIVGDHLAILPDTKGACSWEDGCGVRAQVFCRRVADSVRSSARTPIYDGVESITWGSVTKSLEAYVKAYNHAKGIDQPVEVPNAKELSKDVKAWVASKTLLGDKTSDNSTDLMFFPVVNPKTNKLNEGALRAVMSGQGASADIPEGARASAQSKARSLLESKFKKKVNMRGEDVTECEKKEVQKETIQAAEGVREDQTNQLNEKTKVEGDFDVKDWLNKAPSYFRRNLVSAMKDQEKRRTDCIEKIVACKSVAFCRNELSAIEDTSVLEGICTLVEAVSTQQNTNVVAMQGVNNYQLKGAAKTSVSAQNRTYAAFKDVDYVEMQKERLERERVRRYGR
jgi:hypothetical protein